MVVGEFAIEDGSKWKERIEEQHLDTKVLRKVLTKKKAKNIGDSRRRFVHIFVNDASSPYGWMAAEGEETDKQRS